MLTPPDEQNASERLLESKFALLGTKIEPNDTRTAEEIGFELFERGYQKGYAAAQRDAQAKKPANPFPTAPEAPQDIHDIRLEGYCLGWDAAKEQFCKAQPLPLATQVGQAVLDTLVAMNLTPQSFDQGAKAVLNAVNQVLLSYLVTPLPGVEEGCGEKKGGK